jgi:hypothetical protein
MNQATDNKGKDGVLKTLAIGGFVGLIIIIAWLGIQLISVMPTAFSSLASLADSVYNYKPVELVVANSKSVANAGEAFAISWNKPKQVGSFSFTYKCTEGVGVEIRTAEGQIEQVDCDNAFDLDDANTVDLTISSEKNRFSEIPYTISFIPNKESTPSATKENTVTVVNAMISPVVLEVATSTAPVITDEVKPVVITKPEVVATVPTTTAIKPTSKPTTPVVAKPVVKPVAVSKPTLVVPVSNPLGFTDISIRSTGVGIMDVNNKFIHSGIMDNDLRGSIQFEIRNVGTKTSESFTYTATLPGGIVYTSPSQVALKPNERVVVTLGFDATELKGVESFNVKVNVTGDSNTNNNQFVSAVQVND